MGYQIGKSFLEIREDNTLRILEIEEKPILDIGPPGCLMRMVFHILG